MRKLSGSILALAALLASSQYAEAATQFRFRYMDTIWDGNGNVLIPGTDPNAEKPFSCTDPKGIYGDNYSQQISDVSCYYDQPTVSTADGTLPLKLDAVSAANWCKNVLSNSKAIQANEMIAKDTAAGFSGSSWSTQASSTWTNGVVCSLSGTPIADPPTLRAGTLKLADFETTTTNDWPYWKNTGYAWRPWWATSVDPDIGGAGSYVPYTYGTTGYQDVTVDPSLTASGFPVSVEWLQGTSGYSPATDTADVWLSFLDKNKNELSTLDIGPHSSIYRSAVLDLFAEGAAPTGTAFVRVNMKVNGGWVDNVALRVNGVDVSEINGGYGMPIRPKGHLKNADFEANGTNWTTNQNYDLTYYDTTGSLEDPRKTEGIHSLGNDIGNGYGGMRVNQQVWLNSNDRGKPFSVYWQQGKIDAGNTSDATKIVFFKKDGTQLSATEGVQYYDPSRFWQTRHLSGTVPNDADYAIIDIAAVHLSYVDNVAFLVNGYSYSLKGANNSSLSPDTCPSYVNTVDGPADNRWALSYWDSNVTTGAPYSSTSLYHGTYDSRLPYKYYCVGPNDKWIVGEYMVQESAANAGFNYSAYDYNGNLLSQQDFAYSTRSSSTPEKEFDLFMIPANTAYVKVKTSIYYPTGYSSNNSSATWTHINFTVNGDWQTIPDAPTQIRNAAAQRSGLFWHNNANYPGFISNTPSPEWHSTPGGPLDWDVIDSNGNVTTISCDTAACGDQNGYSNQMLFSFKGDGNYFQDAYISGYNFPAGSPISLSWLQATPYNQPVTSGNISYYSMTMNLSFYDINGNLLGQAEQPSSPQVGANFFGNSLGTTLPANTFRIRLTMKGMKNYGAAIDDIVLKINGTEITRQN